MGHLFAQATRPKPLISDVVKVRKFYIEVGVRVIMPPQVYSLLVSLVPWISCCFRFDNVLHMIRTYSSLSRYSGTKHWHLLLTIKARHSSIPIDAHSRKYQRLIVGRCSVLVYTRTHVAHNLETHSISKDHPNCIVMLHEQLYI